MSQGGWRGGGGGGGGGGGRGRAVIKCHACGETGHKSNECPRGQGRQQQGGRGGGAAAGGYPQRSVSGSSGGSGGGGPGPRSVSESPRKYPPQQGQGRGGGGGFGGPSGGGAGGGGGQGRGGYGGPSGGGRGGGGGGRGGGFAGRDMEVRWNSVCEAEGPPVEPPNGMKWIHPKLNLADLTEDEIKDMKAKERKERVGTIGGKIDVLTNHWLLEIKFPKEMYRYEATINVEKPKREGADDKKGKGPPPAPSKGPQKGKKGGGKGKGGDPPPPGPGGPGGEEPAQPRPVNRDILKKIMRLLVDRMKNDYMRHMKKDVGLITDFSRLLISNQRLEKGCPMQYDIRHSDLVGEDQTEAIYHITIEMTEFNVDLNRVRDIINDRAFLDHPDLTEVKQIYNILMNNLNTMGRGNQYLYAPMGRSGLLRIADPTDQNYLGFGLMNWKGASVICTLGATWKPFLNIEIQNSAILIGQNVLDVIGEILVDPREFGNQFNTRGGPPFRYDNRSANMQKARDVRNWNNRDYDNVMEILKSCKVRRQVKNRLAGGRMETRVARLDGICGFGGGNRARIASEVTFQVDGRDTTVQRYFEGMGVRLQHPNAPVLLLGRAQVPAEFCTIKEGQSINRLLPGNPQRRMLAACTEKPDQKSKNINNFVRDIQLHTHQLLQQFGVRVPDQKMLTLAGTRVLPSPELCYGVDVNGQNQGKGRVKPSDGAWDMWSTSVGFYNPAKIQYMAFVAVGLYRAPTRGAIDALAKLFCSEGRRRGMQFPSTWDYEQVQIARGADHNDTVNQIAETFNYLSGGSNKRKEDSLFVCIIPNKPSPQYGQVKQAAEWNEMAEVLTQCIQEKNLEKRGGGGPDLSIARNILLKINAKMGGINHVPLYAPPQLKHVSILRVPTLIIGMDVTHASVPIKGKPTGFPSYASVTGSLDRTGMPYMIHLQAQLRVEDKAKGAAEVVEGLEAIVAKMIERFTEKNKKEYPRRIIVFRDGVGESQFPEILQREMMAIRRACNRFDKSFDVSPYQPPITFIAVQKRHKVRFFLESHGQVVQDNIPPGTVVDKEIVSGSDFYLLSHKGMLGTSRPTHYHILWDDSNFNMDEIQGLAYFLCYNYSRCNRSVSYPAPTYYAHWGALRAKELASGFRDWTGPESMPQLNFHIERSQFIERNFPMHFI